MPGAAVGPSAPGTGRAVVPLTRVRHLRLADVVVARAHASRFVLDTGIGLTLVTRPLAGRAGVRSSDRGHTGRRMSGQAVTVPLGTLSDLEVGDRAFSDIEVGELDVDGFPPELREVGGFLSLALFEQLPFTVAGPSEELRLGVLPGPPSAEVPLRLERDGPSVSAFVELALPSGRTVSVEVDSGSEALILDTRFLSEFGLGDRSPELARHDGVDETGYAYTRLTASLPGEIALAGAPAFRAPVGPVIFQRIIHDGLLGAGFLSRFDVGFDLARSRMVVGAPTPAR